MTQSEAGCMGEREPRRGQIQAAGIDLSYLEWAETGAPLLLLHGITSSARGWWRVAPELARLGYHVYALDMPGHGQSQLSADHRIGRLAGLIEEALSILKLAKPVVIGHSWGGAAALQLAASMNVAGLVLVDPLLGMSREAGALRVATYLEGVGLEPEQTLPSIRAANPSWHECDFLWKGQALQQCRAEAVRGLFTGSGDWNLTALLGRVDAPLLLMLADPQFSIVSPATLAAAEVALQPDLAEVVRVAGTDHNMFRGGFAPSLRALAGWLEVHSVF